MKKRKYGDAWKDVQIDAEQNDAVFDRFFRRTQSPPESPSEVESAEPREGNLFPAPALKPKSAPAETTRGRTKRPQAKATVNEITLQPTPTAAKPSNVTARVEALKKQYRLSKGEAAILRFMLHQLEGTGLSECYAKIPQLADAGEMTHRGCQFALRNLESRRFVVRVKDYDPSDRLGIKFQLNLPSA